jgi:hypothetical protein
MQNVGVSIEIVLRHLWQCCSEECHNLTYVGVGYKHSPQQKHYAFCSLCEEHKNAQDQKHPLFQPIFDTLMR